MACLGQCNDCNCKDLNICSDTNVIEKQMNDYISQLKDAECEIRKTPCNKIQYAVAKFSNKVWCVSKNNFKLSVNNTYRIDGLCETQKCIIDYLKKLSEFLKAQMQGNVEFSINSKAESDDVGKTTMKSSTSPDGTFKFTFDTNDGTKIIGNGEINGKVDHEYSSNEDGSIKVKVKSITINNVKWDKTADNSAANKNISLHIKDVNGNALYDKNYDGSTSWSEDVNKTVDLNIEKDIQPSSSSGDIQVLTIDDNWIVNTHGNASVKYDNNNKGGIPPEVTCEANCDKCKDKKSEEDKTEDLETPIAPPNEQPQPIEKTKKVVSESPNLVVTETDDAYKLTLNETDKPDKDTVYDDTELRNKVTALENKVDKSESSSSSYNDSEIKAKLKELEEKLAKKEDIPVKYHYVETNINKNGYVLTSGKGNNKITTIKLSDDFNFDYDTLIVDMLFSDIQAYKYTSINDIDESDDQEFSSPEEEAMAKKPNEPLYTFKTGNQIVLDSNSNNHYFNTVFLVGNGDIIYFNFKVNIYSDKLVLSEQSAFLEKAKITNYRTYIPIDPFASTIYYTKIKNKDFDFTISDGLMIKVIRKRLERES